MSSGRYVLLRCLLAIFCLPQLTQAQARPAASGPGSFISIGGGLSLFQSDYGHQTLGGYMAYADLQPTWRYGVEFEARSLNLNSSEQVHERMYLTGLRATLRPTRLSPYVKFLAGDGNLDFPFGYAHGDYLALVPGAGLEYACGDRLTVRAVDFEYDYWPQFSFGPLKPYGVSTGLSIRLNGVRRVPKFAGRARN